MKGFALGLALKQRRKATRKLPTAIAKVQGCTLRYSNGCLYIALPKATMVKGAVYVEETWPGNPTFFSLT